MLLTPSLLGELVADGDGAVEFVDGFENLQAEVLVDFGFVEIAMDFGCGAGDCWPSMKASSQFSKKEYLAVGLDLRQRVERLLQIRGR